MPDYKDMKAVATGILVGVVVLYLTYIPFLAALIGGSYYLLTREASSNAAKDVESKDQPS